MSGLRHPQTLNERRSHDSLMADNHQEYAEIGVRFRLRRGKHGLPTEYDDIVPSNNFVRCWKLYRRSKWKG